MIERLKEFNLEVAEEKTKIICVRKDADKDDRDGGRGNQTFDFLGFTHYIGVDKDGRKRVKRKTSKKKYRASLLRIKEWIKANRNEPIKEFMKTIISKLQGHCNYYGITDNRYAVGSYIYEVKRFLFKWLNRRSQRKSFDWNKFSLFLGKYPLPKAKIHVRIFDLGVGSSYVR